MFGFKKKTDKEIEAEIKKESKNLKEREHREKLESSLASIKSAKGELKHKVFERRYSGLLKGLHHAEQETVKGIKAVGKYYAKPKKRKTTKKSAFKRTKKTTTKRKTKRKKSEEWGFGF